MTNPTLGRNLGRWAEVYFTTPTEQREQAVLGLLRELEQEERDHPELVSESPDESALALADANTTDHIAALEDAVRQFKEPEALAPPEEIASEACPVCQHANLADQWYCGMCGYRLKAPVRSAPIEATRPQAQIFNHQRIIEREVQPEREIVLPSFASEPFPERDPEIVRGVDRTPVWPLQVDDESGGSRSKVIALVVLMMVAGLAFWYQRRSAQPTNPPAQISSAAPRTMPTPAQEPVASVAAPQQGAQPAFDPAVGPPAAPISEPSQSPTAAARTAEPASSDARENASLRAGVPSGVPLAKPNGDRIPTAPDGGYEELARARDLLSGSAGPSNAGQASVWLWKAVGKNNIPAVLMLADLYARGDGVPRSCDQARILLTAALKRGSVEANQKLRELQNSGCSSR